MNNLKAEHRVLQGLLGLLGVAAMSIAVLVFVLGLDAVSLVEETYDTITGQELAEGREVSPTLDSELRFYATFWFAYGAVLLWVARAIVQRLQFVPVLAGLFYIGGVGRALSLVLVGAPHPMFMILMVIELVIPPVMMVVYWRVK